MRFGFRRIRKQTSCCGLLWKRHEDNHQFLLFATNFGVNFFSQKSLMCQQMQRLQFDYGLSCYVSPL